MSAININLLFFILLLYSVVTLAEDDGYLSEEDYFSTIPLVSDASRLPTRKNESPVPVSVITREMIEASGAINIADLFRFVPGYQVGHADGGNFAVNPHDVTNRAVRRIEVKVNGISAYNIFSTSTDWDSIGIQVEDIERVEITRTPNSVSHGFNSFIGSINIITISPLKEHGTKMRVRGGSEDYQSYLLRHSGETGEIYYRFGLDHKTHDGFEDIADNVEVSNVNFNILYSPSFNDEIDIGFYHSDSDSGFVNIASAGNQDFQFDVERTTTREYVKWRHLFSNNTNEFNVNFHHQFGEFEDSPISVFGNMPLSTVLGITPAQVFTFFGAPDQIITANLRGKENRYETSMDYIINHIENFRILIGAGLRYETINAPNLVRNTRQSRLSKSLYASIEWRPTSSLLLNAGFMIQDSNDNTATINPRLSFNYRFKRKYALRGNISYSERTPALLNQNHNALLLFDNGTFLDATTSSDSEIDNERLINYEIGYNGSFFNDHFDMDLNLYYQEISDGVDNFPLAKMTGIIPVIDIYDNISDWSTTGFETEFKYFFGQNAFVHLNYGYADVNGQRLRGLSPTIFENVDDAVAKHSLGILLSKKFDSNLHFGAAYYYQSDMSWLGHEGPVEVNRLDLMARKSYWLGDSKIDLSFILQGLLGNYDELQLGNEFEPRAYFEVSVDL